MWFCIDETLHAKDLISWLHANGKLYPIPFHISIFINWLNLVFFSFLFIDSFALPSFLLLFNTFIELINLFVVLIVLFLLEFVNYFFFFSIWRMVFHIPIVYIVSFKCSHPRPPHPPFVFFDFVSRLSMFDFQSLNRIRFKFNILID